MNPPDIPKEFTTFYYQTFDSNRAELASLYRPVSMLTFNGISVKGKDAISAKLIGLPFRSIRHILTNVHAQPSIHQGAFIVSVTGFMQVDDDANPLNFSQVFQLVPEGSTYYVHNDVFSINLG